MAYRFRKNFPRWRFLSHLSDISYPLYVVHALFGYVVIYAIVRAGASAYVALGGGMLTSYLAACLLHSGVEKQSISISKKLTSVALQEAHSPR
jgi:peptidoglycan/LPS O-acetylase OafA/YrhL